MPRTLTLLACTSFAGVLIAQPGSLDLSFDPGTGASSVVRRIVPQDDGKIMITGNFMSYNEIDVYRVARVNADGSLDTGFDPGGGPDDHVFAMAVQDDGKVLIGGNFQNYDGTPRNYIARLNPDGSVDTSFDPGAGPNDQVHAIVLQPDGRILIAGYFLSYAGTLCAHIARLNPDGSYDVSFDPDGSNDLIRAIALQADGKIIVGGTFTHFDLIPHGGIARLNADGSRDTDFDPGSGFSNESVNDIVVQPDGRIIVIGGFAIYDGVPCPRIARLNSDGSHDTSFDPGDGPGTGANDGLDDIELQPDGKVIIGGTFQDYDGTAMFNFARLDSDGSLDPDFDPGYGPLDLAPGFPDLVNCTVLQADGRILIGGQFTHYDSIPRKNIARVNHIDDTGIHDPFTLECTIHPNPTAGWITLRTDGPGPGTLTVRDHLGRAVFRNATTRPAQEIDLGDLLPGIYTWELRTQAGIKSGKLVKQ